MCSQSQNGATKQGPTKQGKILFSQAEAKTHITLGGQSQEHWYNFLEANPRESWALPSLPSTQSPPQLLTGADQSSGLAQVCLIHSWSSTPSSFLHSGGHSDTQMLGQRAEVRDTCSCPKEKLLHVPRVADSEVETGLWAEY